MQGNPRQPRALDYMPWNSEFQVLDSRFFVSETWILNSRVSGIRIP